MTNRTFIYGAHAVEALLNNTARTIHALYIQEGPAKRRLNALIEKASARNILIQPLSAKQIQQLGEANHQGIVAEVSALPARKTGDLKSFLSDLTNSAFFLILDGITDPHNLGACLRSADAAGVDAVIIPKDKSASLNATVSKVACGAMESTPVFVVNNLAQTLCLLQEAGVWIYGAAGEASASLWKTKFDGAVAIVMGAEGKGLRRLTREHCDALFSIPMHGQVESLNVSVATGIALFEVVKQRTC